MWQGNGPSKNDGDSGENCVHLEEWKRIARIMQFLDGFAKLREASIGFATSFCPFVYPHGTIGLPLDVF